MPAKRIVGKRIQDVINIIVANHYDYSKEEIVYILKQFSDPIDVDEIVKRSNSAMPAPLYETPSDCYLCRYSEMQAYPDFNATEYTRNIHKIHIESCYWVNNKDSPYSSSIYCGWTYIVRFTDDSFSGHWAVRESAILLKLHEVSER